MSHEYCTWEYLGNPRMSQLRASFIALYHVPDVPCVPEIIWDILGCPRLRASFTALFMSQMSLVYLGLPGTSWDVPTKSQLHSLVPCPMSTWDYLGDPMSNWDYPGHPGMSQPKTRYTGWSDVRCLLGITWDIPRSLVPDVP